MFNAGFNPYSAVAKEGLFSALKTKINWGTILTNTQKTLNIVNQAIPLVYQVKPIINNAKTIFKVMGAVRDDGNTYNTYNTNNSPAQQKNTLLINERNIMTSSNTNYSNQPTFFL